MHQILWPEFIRKFVHSALICCKMCAYICECLPTHKQNIQLYGLARECTNLIFAKIALMHLRDFISGYESSSISNTKLRTKFYFASNPKSTNGFCVRCTGLYALTFRHLYFIQINDSNDDNERLCMRYINSFQYRIYHNAQCTVEFEQV